MKNMFSERNTNEKKKFLKHLGWVQSRKKSFSFTLDLVAYVYILSRHVVCNVMKIINPIQPLVLQADIMYSPPYIDWDMYIPFPTRMNTRNFFPEQTARSMYKNLQYCLNTALVLGFRIFQPLTME